jgi:hypothetical protein
LAVSAPGGIVGLGFFACVGAALFDAELALSAAGLGLPAAGLVWPAVGLVLPAAGLALAVPVAGGEAGSELDFRGGPGRRAVGWTRLGGRG